MTSIATRDQQSSTLSQQLKLLLATAGKDVRRVKTMKVITEVGDRGDNGQSDVAEAVPPLEFISDRV